MVSAKTWRYAEVSDNKAAEAVKLSNNNCLEILGRLTPMNNTYFDIQVNGYAGVDFNQHKLGVESLKHACLRLEHDGVEGILATIITAELSDMTARVKQLAGLRDQDSTIQKMIKGIHIEGPFLNSAEGYRGAHPQAHILKPNVDLAQSLLEAGNGLVRIVTLAPEFDKNNKVTRYLHSQGVTVSAGHCNPSLDELKSAIDAGLSMFTHLGNGCPQTLHRHDNIIQRALSLKDDLWLCFIADGHHVPFYALKNYVACAGVERSIVTTDAMAAAGAQEGRYTLAHIALEVGADRVVREPGKANFAGSAIDMQSSRSNLQEKLGLTSTAAQQMTYVNPMKAVKFL